MYIMYSIFTTQEIGYVYTNNNLVSYFYPNLRATSFSVYFMFLKERVNTENLKVEQKLHYLGETLPVFFSPGLY